MATDTPTCEARIPDGSVERPCGGVPTVLVHDLFDDGEYALCLDCAPRCFDELGSGHDHDPAGCARLMYEVHAEFPVGY